MYLVKREVFAASLERAIVSRGVVYEVSLADEKFQPVPKKKKLGFKN